MDKIFVGLGWKGSPAFGFTLCYQDGKFVDPQVTILGLDTFSFLFWQKKV